MNVFHLSAVISFIRHGEKDNHGDLTPTGVYQAIQRGMITKHLKGNVFINHSGINRVQKTSQAISSFLHYHPTKNNNSQINQSIESYLAGNQTGAGVNHPEAVLDEFHYLYDRNKPSRYFESWIPTNPENSNQRAQAFLNFKSKSPEPETTPSPKQMAQRALKILLNQIKIAISTSYQVKENYINVTHEPVLLASLYYLFEDFNPSSKSFVADIGGSFDYVEGFDINVYQNNSDEKMIFLDFREFLKPIDLETLESFVQTSNSI